ncbi:DUF4065 domain-containing protein [Methanimicrococcus sp. OttesenSCG-928-J09]|nr:DUF4065 domain-containing protein [Methanimicrococcus sp. OttesenSCG-928-J09]
MTDLPQCNITDVANWFLTKDSIQHKKLQKLCYYAVAWHYTLLDAPICQNDEFQAWVHGPVNRILFDKYKNKKWLPISKIHAAEVLEFDEYSEEVLDFVWESYGDSSADRLERITHNEEPWINARGMLRPKEKSENVISTDDMKRFYGALFESAQLV